MSRAVKFDLTGEKSNRKQIEFIRAVFDKRRIETTYAYGGAVRGGKTFVILYCLHLLCRNYPGSKWVVVREDLPALKTTTIPSFNKLIEADKYGKWNYSTPITFKYTNGSQIIFKPESITTDKELNSFLGLECNGFFLEQAEELTESMYDMALQRTGSHYIDPMPKPYIFMSFNPSQTWTKEKIYIPYKENSLQSKIYYQEALPSDNPHVTKEQWESWDMLPEELKARMIKGDWTDFGGKNLWLYSFRPSLHLQDDLEFDPYLPIYECYDFNYSPTTCLLLQVVKERQSEGGGMFFLKEFSVDGGTERLCNEVNRYFDNELKDYKGFSYVTGDVSGNQRDTRGNSTDYEIIQRIRKVPLSRFIDTRAMNPRMDYSRDICNTVFHNDLVFVDRKKCPILAKELGLAKPNENGRGLFKDRGTYKMDSFDAMRYGIHAVCSSVGDVINMARIVYGREK
jgi:hypothetical protein